MNTVERNDSIDSTKFILIVLMILGHALELGMEDGNVVFEKMHNIIYSFHMPAFIMLSGYFFNDVNPRKFWKGIANLLLTYAVFQILLCGNPLKYTPCDEGFFKSCLDGLVYNIRHFYNPAGALWYIVSLAAWRVLMHCIPLNNRGIRLIGGVIVLSLLAGFVPLGREFSFQRTFAFFPYFFLGYCHRQFGLLNSLNKIHRFVWVAILFFYVVVIVAVPHVPQSMLVQFYSYSERGAVLSELILRICSYVWMLPISIAVLMLLKEVKVFAAEGRKTLFYYIYHMYLIMVMRIAIVNGAPSSLPFVLLYVVAIVAMLWLLSKISLLNKPLKLIK